MSSVMVASTGQWVLEVDYITLRRVTVPTVCEFSILYKEKYCNKNE